MFAIAKNVNGSYRLYRSTSKQILVYQDTTDTNLPNSTNLGSDTILGIPLYTLGLRILKRADGGYVLYYAGLLPEGYKDGNYDVFSAVGNNNVSTSTLVADPVFLVDSGSTGTVWSFGGDSINENPTCDGSPTGYTGTVKYQWSVDNGTRSWNGSWLTKTQLASVANKTGRYKAIKAQFTSDGTHIAALGNSTFGTKD
jgi:hypothetical protein